MNIYAALILTMIDQVINDKYVGNGQTPARYLDASEIHRYVNAAMPPRAIWRATSTDREIPLT